MPNFKENIKSEIDAERLPEIFKPNDLKNLQPLGNDTYRIGVGTYRSSSINTNLLNFSVGPGDRVGEHVKRGRTPWFEKFGQARDTRYCLIPDDPEDSESETPPDVSTIESTTATETSPGNKKGIERIAEDFVTYLREKPFRIRLNGSSWYPIQGPVSGWEQRLNAYKWPTGNTGKDWLENQESIQKFINDLNKLRTLWHQTGDEPNQDRAEIIYDSIREWGNPKGTRRSGKIVATKLVELWSNDISEVDSTLTKLYAFAEPSKYVIYDSRVATAILSIAEDIYRFKTIDGMRQEIVDGRFCKHLPALGRYEGSGGTRPRGFRWKNWPRAYRVVAAQHQANKLCDSIVLYLNKINEDGRSDWTLREVEAVLFMEGY
jgi:hypothetical protein